MVVPVVPGGELRVWLEAGDQFEVEQAWGEPVREGVGGVREVFYQHIGNGVGPVDEIEDFQGSPDVFKVSERVMAAAIALFAVQQEGAEADVDSYIWVDGQGVAVAEVTGNIERQVTAVEKVEEYFEVLIGRQVVL